MTAVTGALAEAATTPAGSAVLIWITGFVYLYAASLWALDGRADYDDGRGGQVVVVDLLMAAVCLYIGAVYWLAWLGQLSVVSFGAVYVRPALVPLVLLPRLYRHIRRVQDPPDVEELRRDLEHHRRDGAD